jgi:hypothetical protein
MARIATFAILCCVSLASGQSLAEVACLVQAEALAKTHGVTIDPPGGQPADPPNAGELGRSGGVVEPPPTRDPGVLKPPAPFPSDMPTLPDITPSSPRAGVAGTSALRPADRATLQSLLVTARDYGRRGEEDACLRQLGKARDYLAQLPG